MSSTLIHGVFQEASLSSSLGSFGRKVDSSRGCLGRVVVNGTFIPKTDPKLQLMRRHTAIFMIDVFLTEYLCMRGKIFIEALMSVQMELTTRIY